MDEILTRLLFLLRVLAIRAQKRHRHAIKHFKESLELNPFLWEAFENLCELGKELCKIVLQKKNSLVDEV
jgi:hypothetical protein